MTKKPLILLIIALLILGGAGLYGTIINKPMLELSNMGESQHWKLTGHIQTNKDINIFRPVLYLKFSSEEPLAMEVKWNLHDELSYSDANSPQLHSSYKFTSYQSANMIDIPLQNFNFINTNEKEVVKLLSKSSMEIKWKQGNGEEQKEIIYFKVQK